ncbi:nitrilase-related carbon-nitrogen hydrolase [Lacisediminihabitans profunda]|uniref:Hydrolase n=1 Tax=Lacisediminihabitans profunda TaxID=2594790 RepID=A0A5C8ULB5_9MICO|nr:nitrilase-related carbon-nitrogen hydrolase [Lacisediminihabitans profunda]TXN28943.1 hydrolase [Lacisediminihabitans profunda]
MTRIAAVQLSPTIANVRANRDMAAAAIAGALADGADVVVLPELTTSGYVFDSVEELRSVALTADDPLFHEWATMAATRPGSVIVAGFAESGADGALYNSAAVVTAAGVLGVYRKVHLWDQEKRFFTAGSDAPLLVETAHGRLGVMICFDLEFPEWTRIAGLAGTEILAVPTNWPHVDRPDGERAPEVQIAMAAARVNRMAIVCSDRAGAERGVAWNEGTSIIDADGWVVDSVGPGDGIAWADIDASLSRDKRLAELSDAFVDRRPDLYSKFTRSPS